jgi:hypothetical protein
MWTSTVLCILDGCQKEENVENVDIHRSMHP